MSQLTEEKKRQPFREFMEALQLRGIFLSSAQVELNRDCLSETPESNVNIRVKHETEWHSDEEFLIANVSYTLLGRSEGNRKAFARIGVGFDVILAGRDSVPEDVEERFKQNMGFITWPYFREYVDSTSARSAVPIAIAPLMFD